MVKFLRRLHYLFHRRRIDAELAEEMEFHRARKQRQLEEAGLPSAEAAHSARRALGNITLAREDAQGMWIGPWLDSVAQDVTYAFRNLRRQPGFALVAIATLASAIGLNTSLFNVFNAIAFRPWPVEDPGRMVQIFNMNRDDLLSRAGGQPYGFSLAE